MYKNNRIKNHFQQIHNQSENDDIPEEPKKLKFVSINISTY